MTAPGVVIAHRAANDLNVLASVPADLVEADVHLFRGRLEVRHAKTIGPLRVLWERWYLLPRDTPRLLLHEVLTAMPDGVELMLDLKGLDPRLPRAVLDATADWRTADRTLVVCSRVWRTVERLRGHTGISTLHSAGSRRQLRAIFRRCDSGTVEGVSADHRLLSADLVAALRERVPRLWCWPVNDLPTAERLAAWGVTGFITDVPLALRGPGEGAVLSSNPH